MSHSPERNSNAKPPLERSSKLYQQQQQQEEALKHVISKMQLLHSAVSSSPSPSSSLSESDISLSLLPLDPPVPPDSTSLLSDELLLYIFSKLPFSQCSHNSLVCKRWLYLHGRLLQSLRILDWGFLDSGRVSDRFPNLTDIDLVHACIRSPRSSGILVTRKTMSLYVDSLFTPNNGNGGFVEEGDILKSSVIDQGLGLIANWYPNLRRLVAIEASESGLQSIAEECQTLQELELHCCGDMALKGISQCRNLQIVKLVGCFDGFYSSVVSDIGLTILAQGCARLVRLELCGCQGSYDGIKAIGQCCQMLEELTLCDHRMDGGWLAALSYCMNLKTLRLKSCKSIDSSPGPDEHLGCCPTIEELHLQQCQVRDKQGMKALFLVCEAIRDIVFQNCWGLADDVFSIAAICRRVKLISLEGCSLLTTAGLEYVVLSWKELQRLRVVSCNSVKDDEVTPTLASLFSVLRELKWRPDSKSLLKSSLVGTGVGMKGGRFFKRLKP